VTVSSRTTRGRLRGHRDAIFMLDEMTGLNLDVGLRPARRRHAGVQVLLNSAPNVLVAVRMSSH
jgi:hypothetical protein